MINIASAIGGIALGSVVAYTANKPSAASSNHIQEKTTTAPPQAESTLSPPDTSVVQSYIERRPTVEQRLQMKSEGKTVEQLQVYSRLHNQPLSTHTLITSTSDQKIPKELDPRTAYNPQKDQRIIEIIFHRYAQKLLLEKKCRSVQVIQGPIFKKSTRTSDKYGDQIYSSTLKINKKGEYLTNNFYEIVVCNTQRDHYYSGFTIYKNGGGLKEFSMLKKMTSLLQIEEQTGLTFDLQGGSLNQIDFEYLKKDRTIEEFMKRPADL